MFASIEDTIAGVTISPDAVSIIDALLGADRLQAKIVAALDGFDRDGRWAIDGASSLIAWLKAQGLSGLDATQLARAAVRLRALPVTRAAYGAGQLSSGQVDAICANVGPRHAELFAEHEPEVVPALRELSATETARAMQRWRAFADAAMDQGPVPRESQLSVTDLPDGRRLVRGDLSPLTGELLDAALKLAETTDLPDETARTAGERRADALADICAFFLGHRDTPTPARHRPHLHVGIGIGGLLAQGLGETFDGRPVDPATVAALACDADVRRVVMAGRSTILDFGRATRVVPRNLAEAVRERDRGCRFPGCDRAAHWCDVHHVDPWYANGPTRLGNLVLLCGRHHHLIHRPGWRLVLHPDGVLEVQLPDGHIRITRPGSIRAPAFAHDG